MPTLQEDILKKVCNDSPRGIQLPRGAEKNTQINSQRPLESLVKQPIIIDLPVGISPLY